MEGKNTKAAFPTRQEDVCQADGQEFEGMQMRDYFAAKMMASLIINERFCGAIESDVEFAYKIADEMMKQRSR